MTYMSTGHADAELLTKCNGVLSLSERIETALETYDLKELRVTLAEGHAMEHDKVWPNGTQPRSDGPTAHPAAEKCL